MNFRRIMPGLTAAVALCGSTVAARAQARATATLPVQISAFAGITGAYTGLETSRNVGVTGGLDVAVRSFFGLTPALEGRGTYPVADGRLVAEKNVLGGVRLSKRFTNLRPYVDFLYGRAELDYRNGGYPNPQRTFTYQVSSANIVSPGLGAELDLPRHLGVRADFQFQRIPTPVAASGHIYGKPLTLALVYRLGH